ncbi:MULTISPECIES: competence type IV pilus minor pilin ComGG [Streptococcus]|uniref:competence type IV pilus minor pilin ComGG n=1 Tax=Streptococcus TaxID=1301 RepID=UPI001E3C602C|nr:MULTISPECIES: competence type IV pilus minor pilin ComGG [Streptococcus]MDN5022038.1 competence type IV pilus minor pilin ComGG [Streptococcus sp. SP1]MDN5028687.1 competence type IV pilus minor pilin ComGG [Streptococcus sp. SP4]
MSTMWYQRYKMKKVKAGVLLYALLMAAIFCLLLQFYLHRQVAERRILKTSQERLRAYALVQLALEKRKSDEKTSEIHLKSGTVQLKKDTGFLHAQAEMDGESYEFVLPVREEKESKKSQKEKKTRKDKATAGSETPSEETPNEIKEPSENSEKD